jgi:hypothetical protein
MVAKVRLTLAETRALTEGVADKTESVEMKSEPKLEMPLRRRGIRQTG